MYLSKKAQLVIAVLLMAVLAGGSAVLVKIGTKDISVELFTLLRFVVAAIALLPLFLKVKIKINRKFFELSLVSTLAALNVFLFAKGIVLTSANVGSTIYVLAPMVVAIMSFFILKERLNSLKSVGIFLGLAGALIIILLPIIQKGSPFSGDLTGNFLIGIAVISFSLYSVLSKKFHLHYSPIQINIVFVFITLFIMAILNIPGLANLPDQITHLSMEAIISIIFIGALSTALHYVLYQYAVKNGSPLIASSVLYLQPFSTVIWSFLLLGEHLTLGLLIGGALAISGTYLIAHSPAKKEN